MVGILTLPLLCLTDYSPKSAWLVTVGVAEVAVHQEMDLVFQTSRNESLTAIWVGATGGSGACNALLAGRAVFC